MNKRYIELMVFKWYIVHIEIMNNKKQNKEPNQKNDKKSKRIGAAKKEMDGFDLSLEDFNSIPIDDFD